MDANFWGPVLVARAFAPQIARRGGGTIVDVASALAMVSIAGAATYAASKAALWSVSDGLRLELADQHVHVVTAFLAATETDMMAGWDGAMNTPAHVAGAILDGIRDGADEVFVDDDSRAVKASLSASVGERYPDLARSRGRSDLRREDVGVA
jgi:short-subunit dehydrogenase